MWFGHEQELNHLRIFGSWAYDYVPDSQTIKLQKKAKKLLMVRYDNNSTSYYLLDKETKKITISRHVDFHEKMVETGKPKKYWPITNMPVSIMEDENKRDPEIIDEDDEITDEEIEETKKQKQMACELRDRSKLRKPARYETHCIELKESQNVEEVLTGSEAKKWQITIDEEIAAMDKNGTWKSVDQLPKSHKAVSSKIVFKKKLNRN